MVGDPSGYTILDGEKWDVQDDEKLQLRCRTETKKVRWSISRVLSSAIIRLA